jgi:hypothetical protein
MKNKPYISLWLPILATIYIFSLRGPKSFYGGTGNTKSASSLDTCHRWCFRDTRSPQRVRSGREGASQNLGSPIRDILYASSADTGQIKDPPPLESRAPASVTASAQRTVLSPVLPSVLPLRVLLYPQKRDTRVACAYQFFGRRPSGDSPRGDSPSGESPSGESLRGDSPSSYSPRSDSPSGNTPSGESALSLASTRLNSGLPCALGCLWRAAARGRPGRRGRWQWGSGGIWSLEVR